MQIETEDMILFWESDSIYSNWYEPAPIKITYSLHPITFNHSEGLFIAYKSMWFGAKLEDIIHLSTLSPRQAKKYGRDEILNFNQESWNQARERAMYSAVYRKFEQNPELKKELLSTGNKILVEASPYDRVWGIGLTPDNPKALNTKDWKGLNLLGKVLMQVREDLNR